MGVLNKYRYLWWQEGAWWPQDTQVSSFTPPWPLHDTWFTPISGKGNFLLGNSPLSLSTDIRKTLENQLGPDPCYVAKTGHGIQACTTHPRPGRSKELIDWGTQAASGIDLEMPDLKYLLLEMQTGNLRPSTTSLITQDSARWFSLGYWEMHTVNVPTAEGCWTLKFHRYTLEKNIFISKKYGRKGSSVCTWWIYI